MQTKTARAEMHGLPDETLLQIISLLPHKGNGHVQETWSLVHCNLYYVSRVSLTLSGPHRTF